MLSLAEELAFIKDNSASITGFSIWAAGAFDTTYTLSVTPDSDGTDQPLWTIAGKQNPFLFRFRFCILTNIRSGAISSLSWFHSLKCSSLPLYINSYL